MRLGTKLDYAKRAAASIGRHDDVPAAGRARALEELKRFIDEELEAARGREDAALVKQLAAPAGDA